MTDLGGRPRCYPRGRLALERWAARPRSAGPQGPGAPRRPDHVDIAGSEVVDARDLAGMWRSVTGHHAPPVPVPLPGQLGRAPRGGALTDE
jgi:hypothetical protein